MRITVRALLAALFVAATAAFAAGCGGDDGAGGDGGGVIDQVITINFSQVVERIGVRL